MNKDRNPLYLIPIGVYSLLIVFFITTFSWYLSHSNNFFEDGVGTALIVMCVLIAGGAAGSTVPVYLNIKKYYPKSLKKYDDQIVAENFKRENSAALISMSASLVIVPIFVLINSYFKSGLSKKQKEYAETQIKIKQVNDALKLKSVQKKLKTIPDAKRMIENVVEMKEEGLDTEYNCNLYILQILREEGVEFSIPIDEREFYFLGMNF